MKDKSGLKRFQNELSEAVLADIRQWKNHPELGGILDRLHSQPNRKSFFDTYAEALVARHLSAQGCELKFEVDTPQGKNCDFQVSHSDGKFFLHVKRLDTDRPKKQVLSVPSQLRILERIPRPFVVQVRWRDGLSGDELHHLVLRAADFIQQGRVGEEMIARDDDGHDLGGLRILAPWEGDHVSLTIGLPSGFVDEAARFRKLLQRAYKQFMPRATNVILIASGHEEDSLDFENALLGSHVERWDAHPPRGQRVAHGRASDGFWFDTRHSNSACAGWFLLDGKNDHFTSRLWMRQTGTLSSDERVKIHTLINSQDR